MSKEAVKDIYPDEGIFKFDKEFADTAIYSQEKDLRKHITEVVLQQNMIDRIGFGNYITPDIKYLFDSVMCNMLRYKRLNDLIAQAANIDKIIWKNATWREDWTRTLSFWDKRKDESTQWYGRLQEDGLLTSEQMKTLIKYSLDTPAMLYIILKANGFFYDWKNNSKKATSLHLTDQFRRDKSVLIIGTSTKKGNLYGRTIADQMVYLNKDGKFITQQGNDCTLLGIGTQDFFDKQTGKIASVNIGDIKKQDISFTSDSDGNTSGLTASLGANVATTLATAFIGVVPLALAVLNTVANVAIPNIYTSQKSDDIPIWTIDKFGDSFSDKMDIFDTLHIYFIEKNVSQRAASFIRENSSGLAIKTIKNLYKQNKPKSFIKLDDTVKKGGTRKLHKNKNNRRRC